MLWQKFVYEPAYNLPRAQFICIREICRHVLRSYGRLNLRIAFAPALWRIFFFLSTFTCALVCNVLRSCLKDKNNVKHFSGDIRYSHFVTQHKVNVLIHYIRNKSLLCVFLFTSQCKWNTASVVDYLFIILFFISEIFFWANSFIFIWYWWDEKINFFLSFIYLDVKDDAKLWEPFFLIHFVQKIFEVIPIHPSSLPLSIHLFLYYSCTLSWWIFFFWSFSFIPYLTIIHCATEKQNITCNP